MATLAWVPTADHFDPEECLVMASRLQVRRHRSIPAFLLHTLRIRRQLAAAEGCMGNAVRADLLSKTFWTVSAWRDAHALAAFNRADPHRSSVKRIRPAMETSAFLTWTAHTADLPITWHEAQQRLADQAATR